MALTYHAFSAVFFREASFNIVVHCCESVGDAGCLDENKEGGGPLPSSPHFSSSSTKTRPTQGKEKTLRLKNGAKTRRAGGVVSSTKTRQARSLDVDNTYPSKTLPFGVCLSSFFAKTEMQVEHLRFEDFITPFSP